MTRREARKSLGTRTARRRNTKTKCMSGSWTQGAKVPEYRYFHRQRERPRAALARIMKAVKKREEGRDAAGN